MTTNENLIIRLIQQDMKHHQLVAGICHLGFETEIHYSGMLNIIAELMGHPATAVPDPWADTYMHYLTRAEQYPITHLADHLRCLAQDTYTALSTLSG